MKRIVIVGLGPGSAKSLTVRAMEVLKSGAQVIVRTCRHPSISVLDDHGIQYESFDGLYEQIERYDQLYQAIADTLVAGAVDNGTVIYAVPGHPLLFEDSSQIVLEVARQHEICVDIVHGVSFIDGMLGLIPLLSGSGFTVVAADGPWPSAMEELPVLIGQVSTKQAVRRLKRRLFSIYGATHVVHVVTAADHEQFQEVKTVAIASLDRLDVNHLTTVFVPASKHAKRSPFSDAVEVIARLRDPDGCPWDREQTIQSLRPYVIEEAYEVVSAIEDGSWDKMCEELGDLMLEVLLLAQIASETGKFTIYDVLDSLTEKMIRRHPHVFADSDASTADEVVAQWETIKRSEKNEQENLFSSLPRELPALLKAFRVQEKAAQVGFDWDEPQPVFEKVREELAELVLAYREGSQERIEEEVGDLLFSVVNLCRFVDAEPEMALRGAIKKFVARFTDMEQMAKTEGRRLEEMTLNEMDELWEFCKRVGRRGEHKP